MATIPKKIPGRPFQKGVSGNPAGRKPGQRHRTTVMLEKLMDGDAAAIVKTVMAAALLGDMTAARMILDRVAPAAKDRLIIVDLPDTSTAEGVALAQSAIVSAVTGGQLLPSEGVILSDIVESRRRAIETNELALRIDAIEGRAKL